MKEDGVFREGLEWNVSPDLSGVKRFFEVERETRIKTRKMYRRPLIPPHSLVNLLYPQKFSEFVQRDMLTEMQYHLPILWAIVLLRSDC